MKVVIMCGGKGTRLREETEHRPKPMVEIGGRPILWHIMQHYARYGYKDFVLTLGYKGQVIKEYFLQHQYMHNDFTVDLSSGNVTIHQGAELCDWRVTLYDTGEGTEKGARIARVAHHLGDGPFMVTYGDGVSNVNIDKLIAFHEKQGTIGTFTGVHMPSRFGAVETSEEGHVTSWKEKPILDSYINSGFFVFENEFLEYLTQDESCDLEKEPLEKLAAEKQLSMYRHDGFWHCMDTYRDYLSLKELWDRGNAPWTIFQ
jgi:glucose-1-phosphate cytidylyltransferase